MRRPRRLTLPLLLLAAAAATQLLNVFPVLLDLGAYRFGEVNPLLFLDDTSIYVTQLQKQIHYGTNRMTQYEPPSPPTLKAWLPSTLLAPALDLLGLKWFYFGYQLAVGLALFLLCHRLLLRLSSLPLASCVLTFYLFAVSCFLLYTVSELNKPLPIVTLRLLAATVRSLLVPPAYSMPLRHLLRFPTRSLDLILILCGLLLMLRSQRRYDRRTEVGIATLLVLCALTAAFGTQVFLVCYAAHLLALYRRRSLALSLGLFCLGGLVAGLVVARILEEASPETLRRAGLALSRLPSLQYAFVPLLCLAAVGAAFLLRPGRRAGLRPRESFVAWMLLGFTLLGNQNLVTGRELQLYHLTLYTSFLSPLLAAGVVLRRLPEGLRRIAVSVCLVVAVAATARTLTAAAGADAASWSRNASLQRDAIELSPRLSGAAGLPAGPVSYLVIGARNLWLDWILQATSAAFAFVPYPTLNRDLSFEDSADILATALLAASSVGLDGPAWREVYDHYARKTFFYYFRGAPGRPDIFGRRPDEWDGGELALVSKRLERIDAERIDRLIERGGLRYLVLDAELSTAVPWLSLAGRAEGSVLCRIEPAGLGSVLAASRGAARDRLTAVAGGGSRPAGADARGERGR
jgi:hypothetical protein